jgi:hypothetical protein
MRYEPTPAEAAEMSKYGIVHRPVDYFQLGEFRYSSLKDAIAAGQRQATAREQNQQGLRNEHR